MRPGVAQPCPLAPRNRPRLEQAGKFTRMIDMQVGQKNDVGVCQSQLGFTEPSKCSRSGIYQYARCAVDEHEITRRGAPDRSRTARPEYHEFERCL